MLSIMAAKKKSKKQVAYLLSSGSPLSGPQKAKLKSELHSGSVKIASKPKKKPSKYSQAKYNKAHKSHYKMG